MSLRRANGESRSDLVDQAAAGGRPWITVEMVAALARAVRYRAATVWMYLWARADRDTGRAWPGMDEVASAVGIDRRHVRRDIKALIGAGWLRVEPRSGHSNHYRVLAPPCAGVAVAAPPLRREGAVSAIPGGAVSAIPGGAVSAPQNLTKNLTKNTTKKRAGAPPNIDEVAAGIPPELDTAAFRAAWSEWLTYRTRRNLTREPMTLEKQLHMLADLGADGAVESIDTAIRSGWSGVFRPKPARSDGHEREPHGQRHDPARPVQPG